MCLSLYDYESKGSRYSYEITYLKIRVITNQKHKIDSQKPKRKELKHNTNHKRENKKEEKGTKMCKINWKTRFKMAINTYYQ